MSDAPSQISGATGSPEQRRTLLIFCNDEADRMILRTIFKDAYHLLMAADEPTAINLIGQNEVDVGIFDFPAPEPCHIELLDRLKAIKPNLQSVVKTAFEPTRAIKLELNRCGCGYFYIPFDLATTRSAVADAMQRRSPA